MLFNCNIVLLKQKADNRDDALKILSDAFLSKGLVKDSFYEALLARENQYPTGLYVEDLNIGVAICHTDSEHVLTEQIGFMSLVEPVVFREMTTGENINVSLIFMLALKDGNNQLQTLMKLMDVFSNDQILLGLQKATSEDEFYHLMEMAELI